MKLVIEMADGPRYGSIHRENCRDVKDGECIGEASNRQDACRLAEELTNWDWDLSDYHVNPCTGIDNRQEIN
jgi:hypothetical protein